MPFGPYEDFDSCVAANSDKDDPEAYCGAIKDQVEASEFDGERIHDTAEKYHVRPETAVNILAEAELHLDEDDPCWDGYTMVGTKIEDGQEVPRCVPDDDVPDANLSTPRVMASASPLDTQPIEREELGDGRVAYRGLKLISEGIWTDSASETPTLYDERTFENTTPEYDSSTYGGPPVNIAHDLHKDGPKKGEPHEASIGGYIDPDSLDTDGTALYGDVILDTGESAGAFADDNLKSALKNDGTAGFSPSVELMPSELEDADHPRAEEYVPAATLSGLGLVRDPASHDVDLSHETDSRAVALAAHDESGATTKALYLKDGSMSQRNLMDADAEELRQILDNYGFENLDEMDDEDVAEVAADLHDDLMGEMEGDGESEGEDGAEMEDYEDKDEEEEDDKEMVDEDALGPINEQIDDIWDELSQIKEEMIDDEEMSAELEDAKAELAAADTVEDVDERLKTLEDQPAPSKVLAEGREDEEEIDWSAADDGIEYDPATGSMSR